MDSGPPAIRFRLTSNLWFLLPTYSGLLVAKITFNFKYRKNTYATIGAWFACFTCMLLSCVCYRHQSLFQYHTMMLRSNSFLLPNTQRSAGRMPSSYCTYDLLIGMLVVWCALEETIINSAVRLPCVCYFRVLYRCEYATFSEIDFLLQFTWTCHHLISTAHTNHLTEDWFVRMLLCLYATNSVYATPAHLYTLGLVNRHHHHH